MNINNNNYSIIEIIDMLDRKNLIVNSEYQRGSGIWPPGPSSYFIDTILEGFPFPKIYMYEFLDPTKRRMRKEIVDGQQRIGTIQRFYDNGFALTGESNFAGSKFEDLEEEDKNKFLSYSVSVDVIRNANRAEILQMFRRMNAYTLPLNESEKRHSSYQGKFKWFVNQLADELNEVFLEFSVFKKRQIVRMSDAALITECIVAFEKGIVSSSPADLRNIYKKYDENFALSDDYRRKIVETFSFVTANFSALRNSHLMKPYALHSLITALVHNRFGIQALRDEFDIVPTGNFTNDPVESCRTLVAMAQAHEAKELEGPFHKYVWGCTSTTDRKLRRTARVASMLRALGAEVPGDVDDNIA